MISFFANIFYYFLSNSPAKTKIILLTIILVSGFLVNPVKAGWEKEIIYFILVDRFANGDNSNDLEINPNNPLAFHGGDIEGIIQKLDYLQDLGVTTLWLSPIQKNRPGHFYNQYAYHGYWIWDFFTIDPRFGTENSLKRLSDELHRRNMKLILDVVVNHAGYDAPIERLFPIFFHLSDEIRNWDNALELEQYKLFGLPDFASEKPIVQFFFYSVARYLIKQFNPDGFRLDAVRHVPLTFWRKFNSKSRNLGGPNFFLLGEQLNGDPSVISETWIKGNFSSLFDYPLYYTLLEVIANGKSCKKLALRFASDEKYPVPEQIATFLDNHDLDRFFTSCSENISRFKLALGLLFTVRGIPTLYYGDETGMTGTHHPNAANRQSMNFASNPELREYVKQLISIRKTHPSLTEGYQVHLAADDNYYAFARICRTEAAIITINTASKPIEIKLRLPFLISKITESAIHKLQGKVESNLFFVQLPPETVDIFFVSSQSDTFASIYQTKANERLIPSLKPLKSITFVVQNCPADFNETVHIIGSIPQLGDWNPQLAPKMKKVGHNTFEINLKVPEKAVFEWKFIRQTSNGKVIWQEKENNYLDLTMNEKSQIIEQW